MQQVYIRSETVCIYAAQVQWSHAPIPLARTACPGLTAPSSRDMLLGCLGSRRGKKSTHSRSCGKARLSPEEASSQVVLKLRPSKVPDHFSTSMNENSAPTQVSHGATPFQAAVKLLRAVLHTSCMKKRKEPKALQFPSTTVLTGL